MASARPVGRPAGRSLNPGACVKGSNVGRELPKGSARRKPSHHSPSWCLGLGMHLFRKFEREGNAVGNRSSRTGVIVKKPLGRRSGKSYQEYKATCLLFSELPFPVVRSKWSPRRSGWRLGSYSAPASSAKVRNPSIYHGLKVKSDLSFPRGCNSYLYALRRQGFVDFPGPTQMNNRRVNSLDDLAAAVSELWGAKEVKRDWDFVYPVKGTRSQKRLFWFARKVVKKAPRFLRTGLISRDLRRIVGICRKWGGRSPGKAISFFVRRNQPRVRGGRTARGMRGRR